MHEPNIEHYISLIELAHKEDLGPGDVTSLATIPPDFRGLGRLVFRESGVLCGMPIVREVLKYYDPDLRLIPMADDGDFIAATSTIAEVAGSLRSVLAAERVVLNFLQRLSGISTITAQYIKTANNPKVKICDTRKTTPGWRALEKYAVACGGGCNHRHGLYDAVLIKDNHLVAIGADNLLEGLKIAMGKIAQQAESFDFIEVEVDDLDQLRTVLQVPQVNIVLLDNMTPEQLKQAVTIRSELSRSDVQLEASGNVNLNTIAEIARTNVDRISVGALTHSVCSLDIGFDL